MLCKETASELQEFFKRWKTLVDEITIAGLHNFSNGHNYISIDKYKRINICYFPFTVIEVLWNGDVVPCCYDFNGCLNMGNIYEDSLNNIWNGKRYKELRRLQLTRKFPTDLLCRRCHRNRTVSLGIKYLETSISDLKTDN
jgi:radical SAM protein with 4Fe4S-binding SPASM domain